MGNRARPDKRPGQSGRSLLRKNPVPRLLGHDLRNPLAAITMGATLLTKADSIDDKQARVAARILNSAGRMSRLINYLLDLARTRFGSTIPLTRARMDLAPV